MKPTPELVFLSDAETYTGADGSTVVDAQGNVYDLIALLGELTLKEWARHRLTRSTAPLTFEKIESSLSVSGDDDFRLRG